MAEPSRQFSPSLQVECRVCHTAVSVPGGGNEGRFRCPKCLHEMPLKGVWPSRMPAPEEAVARPLPTAAGLTLLPGGPLPEASAASPPGAALEQEIRDLQAECDRLQDRLQTAVEALREAAVLISRVATLEERVGALAGRYLEASLRMQHLERENARLRAAGGGA